jgi:hypothetical protein
MLDFDSLAAAFDRQSSLTIYCAVRQLSSDLAATVYPAWLIKDYGEPFEESRSESADGSIDQVLLFSDCRNPDARQEVLNPWRYEAEKAGAEVIRRGLTASQGFLHSRTVEWILTCIQHVPWSKTDFIDQDEFDIAEGLVTTLRNAWVTSDEVCRQLAKGDAPKGEATGHEPQVSVQDGDGIPLLALKALVDGGGPGLISQAMKVPAKARYSTTMMKMLDGDPKYFDWSLEDWVSYLKASKRTIAGTDAWRRIMRYREGNKQDRSVE